MTLKEVVQLLREGSPLYGARAKLTYGLGDRMDIDTQHYCLDIASSPNVALTIEENEALELVKTITPLYVTKVIISRSYDPNVIVSIVYYLAAEPFKIWVRQRGVVGHNNINVDWFVVSLPITTMAELREFFESQEETLPQ